MVCNESALQAQDCRRVPQILDTHVLPKWGYTALKDITYRELAPWIAGLGLSGSLVPQLDASCGRTTSTRLGPIGF